MITTIVGSSKWFYNYSGLIIEMQHIYLMIISSVL